VDIVVNIAIIQSEYRATDIYIYIIIWIMP
jgi:hypothetical protein